MNVSELSIWNGYNCAIIVFIKKNFSSLAVTDDNILNR